MALFDSYRNRRQALDTLLDSFNYIEANYETTPFISKLLACATDLGNGAAGIAALTPMIF